MTLYALQDLDDALRATTSFLLPFEFRRWLLLAVIVFFAGSGISLPSAQFDAPTASPGQVSGELPSTALDPTLPIVVALVGGIVVLGALFTLVGAIMDFVLVESLRTHRVTVRAHWARRWRQGVRLFGFRIALGIVGLGLALGSFLPFLLPLLTGDTAPIPSAGAFLLGVPVLLAVGLFYGLVSGFTTAFVVPIMIRTESGVLSGWRRLLSSIGRAWKQYLVYAVIAAILGVAAGILTSIAVGLLAVAVLLPLAIVAGITHVAVSLSSTAGLAVLVILGGIFLCVMIVGWALVRVPIVSYLRYYALLVLGDIDSAFDIIPDQRSTIRE